jgi:hypothetical protein
MSDNMWVCDTFTENHWCLLSHEKTKWTSSFVTPCWSHATNLTIFLRLSILWRLKDIWQLHHYWHSKKNPNTSEVRKEHAVSFLWRTVFVTCLNNTICIKVIDHADCTKSEAFKIMEQNWVTNTVKPCNVCRIITLTVGLLSYWKTTYSCITCLMRPTFM